MAKRPTRNDDEIVRKAAERLMPDVLEWLSSNGDDVSNDEEERNNTLDQLVGAIKGSFDNDGYHLAKELDRDGWDPDSRLVEILDSADSFLRDEVRKASIEWFKSEGITPHPTGARVKSKQRGDSFGKIGTIVSFQEDGRYTVNIPELGHKDPNDRKSTGTIGQILDHENLECVP
jgi:hypothetical protein